MSSRNEKIRFQGVTKQFPGVIANEDITFGIKEGSVHALLGENGAGKTTLMNILYGLYQPTNGHIVIDGETVGFENPEEAIEHNIGMIHQHFMLVDPLSVRDNVALGWEPRKYGGFGLDYAEIEKRIKEISNRYGLEVGEFVQTPIRDLGVGIRQRVEIVKTLFRGADIFILDEPTAVLTPQEVEDLFNIFDELTSQGKTLIFITHKLEEAIEAADEITVLRNGRNVGTVKASETDQNELAEMMVGREVLLEVEKGHSTFGKSKLELTDVSVTDDNDISRLNDIDLTLREGEILGVAGVDGNGQKELIEAISGLRDVEEGTIRIDGENVTDLGRREIIQRGVGYIPEDRQERGLIMNFTLRKNGLLGSQYSKPFNQDGRLNWSELDQHIDRILEEYDIQPRNPMAIARSLSGGNQQKFVVGRELSRIPAAELLLASHPTRGVDIGSKEFIHEQLLEMRRNGKAILLVSASLDEITDLSDRIAVIFEGEFVDVVDPESVTREQLGMMMAGHEPNDVQTDRVEVGS